MVPRLVDLSGAPHAMGVQYGKQLREEVHALAEERLRLSMVHAAEKGRPVDRADCLALAARFLPAFERYAPEVFAEFQGIAEGARIAPELLLIGNGYTDFRDVLALGNPAEECSAFWVRPEDSGGRTLCGQTWDMHATAAPFVTLVHRRPAEGPETLSLTTAGCLSLIGVNSAGIAVGNTNLVPTDARPGVIYLAMIHRALAATTWEEALAAITEAPRASGHNYYLADAAGQVCNLETTATRTAPTGAQATRFVHTNHYTAPELLDLAAPPDPTSTSRARASVLGDLLAGLPAPLGPDEIGRLLTHHEAGPGAICVHPTVPDGGRSCGAAILCPQTREMWACAGNPCQGELLRFALGEL